MANNNEIERLPPFLQAPAYATDMTALLNTPEYRNVLVEAHRQFNPQSTDVENFDMSNTVKVCGEIGRQRLGSFFLMYVPLSGGEGFFPAIFCHARAHVPVTIMTGKERWGRISDVQKDYDVNMTLGTHANGNYDHVDAWSTRNKKFAIELGTMGPLSPHRDIIAEEAAKGNKVTRFRLTPCEIVEKENAKGESDVELRFHEPEENRVYDNMAYWITAGGKEKICVYQQCEIIPNTESPLYEQESRKIGNLQKFIEKITPNGGLVMLQKGIPAKLLREKKWRDAAMKLLAPKRSLVKAVLCDEIEYPFGQGKIYDGMYVDGLKGNEKIDVGEYGVVIGHGASLYIYTPEPQTALDLGNVPKFLDLSKEQRQKAIKAKRVRMQEKLTRMIEKPSERDAQANPQEVAEQQPWKPESSKEKSRGNLTERKAASSQQDRTLSSNILSPLILVEGIPWNGDDLPETPISQQDAYRLYDENNDPITIGNNQRLKCSKVEKGEDADSFFLRDPQMLQSAEGGEHVLSTRMGNSYKMTTYQNFPFKSILEKACGDPKSRGVKITPTKIELREGKFRGATRKLGFARSA